MQVGHKVSACRRWSTTWRWSTTRSCSSRPACPYPTADWTWDDFRAAAQKLTDPSTKQFGWAYVADGSEDTVWRFDALLWQAGGDILNSDNTKAEFNSPAGVKAATLLQQMSTVDHSVYLDNGNGNYANLFNSGKIAMLFTGPWDLSGFPDVDYGVQVLPGDQNHQTISGPDQWVLFDNGDQRKQAAWTFLKWLTSPEQALIWSTATGDLPIRASETKLPGYAAYVAKYPGVSTFVQNEEQRAQGEAGDRGLQRGVTGDGSGDRSRAAGQGPAAAGA